MLETLEQAIAGLELAADWVGMRVVQDRATTRRLRDGHPECNRSDFNAGAMVEVLVGGQFGYAATNQLSPEGLQAATQRAYAQAQAARPFGLYQFDAVTRPASQGQYQSPQHQPFAHLSTAAVSELLQTICQKLRVSDAIVATTAEATTHQRHTWYASSSGAALHQQFALMHTDFSATAQAGPVVQTRTNHGPYAQSFQGGWEQGIPTDLWQRVAQVGEQAAELVTAPECPTDRRTLVLAPDQMMLQIHESIGHPLELDRILGDERNYAGGSFVRREDFGHLQYGSPLLNVTFDPTVPQELASYAYDDTGVPAQRQYLIRHGRLERGLGSLESQARSQVPGVACARATTWNRPAIDRMANINLEPGDTPFAALIGNIETGIFMEANRSWSIDDRRYKFQFGCEYGRLIENGQLTHTVRNPNYRATTPEFWHSLSQVGDRATWQVHGTPMCGKGEPNQIIQVGHGAPVCAFDQVAVFGGA